MVIFACACATLVLAAGGGGGGGGAEAIDIFIHLFYDLLSLLNPFSSLIVFFYRPPTPNKQLYLIY